LTASILIIIDEIVLAKPPPVVGRGFDMLAGPKILLYTNGKPAFQPGVF